MQVAVCAGENGHEVASGPRDPQIQAMEAPDPLQAFKQMGQGLAQFRDQDGTIGGVQHRLAGTVIKANAKVTFGRCEGQFEAMAVGLGMGGRRDRTHLGQVRIVGKSGL